jgi:hypothetical protein
VLAIQDHLEPNDAPFGTLKPQLLTDMRDEPRVDDRRMISGIVLVLDAGRGDHLTIPTSLRPTAVAR